MKILYTSDIHVDPNHMHRFLDAARKFEVGIIIIGGDLIPVREWKLSDAIAPQREWVTNILIPSLQGFKKERPQIKILLDFGNDDLLAARSILEKAAGHDFLLIHNRVVEICEKQAVVGYMNIPPTPFKLKDWEKADCPDRPGLEGNIRKSGTKTDSGKEKSFKLKLSNGTIQDDLSALSKTMTSPTWAEHTFIFVSHCPPLNTNLDGMHDGEHVGSLAIRRFVERWRKERRLLLSLHGHIHEGPDVSGKVFDTINGALCCNMGQIEGQLQALFFDSDNVKNTAKKISLFRQTCG